MSSDDWYLVVYLLIPLIILCLFWWFVAPKRWHQDDEQAVPIRWGSAFWGMGLGSWFGLSLAKKFPEWSSDWSFVVSIACFVIAICFRRFEARKGLSGQANRRRTSDDRQTLSNR